MVRLPSDPPPPGACKLRIKSNGDTTHVFAVDEFGIELEILGAVAVSWKHDLSGPATACVRVAEAEVEIEAEKVAVSPA